MDFDDYSRSLPAYLAPNEKIKLFDEIKKFNNSQSNTNYYLENNTYPEDILQGDAWHMINFIDPISGSSKSVKGLVISNSCDSSAENKRDFPLKIIFSPLIELKKYINLIETNYGKERAAIVKNKITEQKISQIMYLPPSTDIPIETIALLDNVVSVPHEVIKNPSTKKAHCLSQFGFYLYVIKLSIHFTRFNEGVARFE